MNVMACKSSRFVWSRDLTRALIEEYEKYPSLYEVSSIDYRKRDKKLQVLKQIAADLNRSHLTALTEEEIKAKLHGIRTQYFQELRKVEKSKVTGSSTDSIYIPKLWCFDMLHFLGRGEPASEGESNLGYETQPEDNVETEIQDIENRDPNEGDLIYDGDVDDLNSSDITVTPLFSPISKEGTSRTGSRPEPSRKRKREEKGVLLENAQATLEMASMALRDLKDKDKDSSKDYNPISFEHRVFGNIVGMELDKIKNEEELDRLKMKITTLIYECKERCRAATRQQENLS